MSDALRLYLLIGVATMAACLVATDPLKRVLAAHNFPGWLVYLAAVLVVLFWPFVLAFVTLMIIKGANNG